jgi:predicted RecA/RadA family phage recombinase
MKNYLQAGEKITITAAAAIASGAGVLVGAMFGVAAGDALSGQDVTIVRKGVFSLNKLSAQAWTPGEAVYWDDTAKECTTVSAGNAQIGFAASAAADPSAVGTVVLI